MSIEEQEALTESLERKWNKTHTRDFVNRMERKMHRKERRFGHI